MLEITANEASNLEQECLLWKLKQTNRCAATNVLAHSAARALEKWALDDLTRDSDFVSCDAWGEGFIIRSWSDPHKVGHASEQEEEEVPNALSRPLEGLEITPSFQFRKKTGTRKGKGSFDHMSK